MRFVLQAYIFVTSYYNTMYNMIEKLPSVLNILILRE
jgi:hypothetical protein